MKKLIFSLLLLITFSSFKIVANTGSNDDTKTVNDLVSAVYKIISGPAGPRDWARLEALFHKDGYMGISQQTANGMVFRKFTVAEYAKNSGSMFQQYAFTETEIGRLTQEFGNIAQVFSPYAYKLDTPKPVERRGINSFQLVKDNGRWYILSIIWQEETAELPIPKKYLEFKN